MSLTTPENPAPRKARRRPLPRIRRQVLKRKIRLRRILRQKKALRRSRKNPSPPRKSKRSKFRGNLQLQVLQIIPERLAQLLSLQSNLHCSDQKSQLVPSVVRNSFVNVRPQPLLLGQNLHRIG